MSKIICDVCGTSYPETATQCPICGCVRPGDAKTVAGNVKSETGASGTYTYVKGGRFSKANVRKRNLDGQNHADEPKSQAAGDEKKENRSDKGLTIAVVVLLVAIVAVVLYIVLRIFGGDLFSPSDPTDGNTSGDSQPSSSESAPSTELNIPCVNLTLDTNLIELNKMGSAYLLNVTADPVDTTDELIYLSSDETIVSVSSEGKVTAEGAGEAIITVTCGAVEVECRVVCTFEEVPPDTSDPSTDPSTEPTEPVDVDIDLKLNREDFTLSSKGSSWQLYDGDNAELITWTSDDETIATIENGKVVGVGPGVTNVHGEYNGERVSCIVRCSFSASNDTPADAGTESSMYHLSKADVTTKVGETFYLYLMDTEDKVIGVTFTASNENCTVNGNAITRVSEGYTEIYVTYEGVTYTCIVRSGQ